MTRLAIAFALATLAGGQACAQTMTLSTSSDEYITDLNFEPGNTTLIAGVNKRTNRRLTESRNTSEPTPFTQTSVPPLLP